MVHTVKGDVFTSGADIIAHGVNCKGGFGSGVAGIIAKRYPEVRNAYMMKFKLPGWQLGDVQFVMKNDGKLIANCATQRAYLPRGPRHADYNAIRECMMKVRDFAKEKNLTIAIPKIGCGLAGGEWKVVKKILAEVFDTTDITVYSLD